MLGLIGSTLSLLAGFFPMIPTMSRDATPVTAAVFFPSLVFFVRKTDWKVGALAFAAGLAYVL